MCHVTATLRTSSATNMAASAREKQSAALKQMLNFGQVPAKQSAEPTWKILIYDRFGQDIIAPLLSQKDLRDLGVTLHLLLHSDRDSVPDVPAIYFVMPTEENIHRICQDCQDQLYESFYLNFISAISRQRLEELAGGVLQSNAVANISKVYDQYLNFISLEDDLLLLRQQGRDAVSYYAINRGDVKDTEMEQIMDMIVDSLFSVFVTLGNVPVIRCPRGNAAEMVAEKLDKKLRENLRDARSSLFAAESLQSGQFSFQRPLLVILDRNLDLATMLHHTWTYQALGHDVLDLQLNRITVEEGAATPSGHAGAKTNRKKKIYDLGQHDKFWAAQKASPFPAVAEAVQEALDSYRASEDEVKHLKHAMGLEGDEEDQAISMLSDTTAKLTSAVHSLPELLEQKRVIDMHTTIATAILDHIKERKLDVYFEMEEKLMSRSQLDKSLMDIITNPEAGSAEDKMRLFLIALLCGQPMTEAEIDQYAMTLQETDCDIAPLNYIRKWRAYAKISAAPSTYTGGGTKTVSMFSKLMADSSKFVMEGVKNLVVKKHKLPVTRIVDALMEMKPNDETDDYRYFDPKMLRASDSSSVPRNKQPYQEAFVFMVGGGNYIEYQNLVDYVKSRVGMGTKRITYGCTDLQNASQFLMQFGHLGKESH
ncbi:PREDICTED: sec1 family domain-containing protein 1-like [Priapulus caudatus]|uniref:Sec1 family domain-containing protein 1-like n=1 Tax=Priapulus caudatus TaxID=37621 RepID=A0ABM1EG18_PRICU|nr:PREDICTED: sec1 family domain-containing protein 1-like [Priapulus caudatus]